MARQRVQTPCLKLPFRSPRGPARASCPTMHSAPCPTSNCCLSTGVTGSRSRLHSAGLWPYSRAVVLCRPDAWGRVSFAHTPVSILGWIYDPDHSLPPGMYVDVPHLDCLLVAALIPYPLVSTVGFAIFAISAECLAPAVGRVDQPCTASGRSA